MKSLLITGTDTGSGKTLVTAALMQYFKAEGLKVAGMKPVAAGAVDSGEGLQNEDALLLQQSATEQVDYKTINPYCFEPPIAPHIAAIETRDRISLGKIQQSYQQLSAANDLVLVEGAGGWRVPLSDNLEFSDIAKAFDLPVVLVVGLKLGCINHARLTAESILADGLKLAGWIVTQVEPDMLRVEKNLQALQQYLPAPCWGKVPYLKQATAESLLTYLHPEE